ncbi:MAG TPA: GlxA family transcriptional regulator [Roseiarcus sp.]|nr:GlxA family transcriptional regulator [Roseiarcus sp.]
MTNRIAMLVFPDFQILDAAGPIAAFEIAARYREGTYVLEVVAKHAGAVESSSGAAMQARALGEAGPLDMLIVAGGDGTRQAVRDEELIALIRVRAPQARRIASVCSGAFLLAEAGLLDGRRATTHWQRGPQFARDYPRVRLEADRIYVRDGPVWTSAGITAGIDLALAMIAEDLGEEVARRTARQLVVYRQRAGGQSQFSALAEIERQEGRFAKLLGWAHQRLGESLSVERLAEQAAMSPRHFSRAFARGTGVSPARAIERLRLEAARALIETSAEPIERVAGRVGFGDPERMRRAFLRVYGQPPRALRRATQK